MNITSVKVRKVFNAPDTRVKAIVSITLDGVFAVHDLKVIQGVDRLFVAMPNRRSDDGSYQDIVHPINHDARKQIEDAVMAKYEETLVEAENAGHVHAAAH